MTLQQKTIIKLELTLDEYNLLGDLITIGRALTYVDIEMLNSAIFLYKMHNSSEETDVSLAKKFVEIQNNLKRSQR